MIRIQTIVAAAVVVVGKTVKDMRSTTRYYASQRAAIRLQGELERQAIKKAGEVIKARIEAGYYRNPLSVTQDLNSEIERQKKIILQTNVL